MKIVRPYAHIMPPPGHLPETPFIKPFGDEILRRVEWCGRISHRSEDVAGTDTEKFLRTVVLGHGDWSIVEHCVVSVLFLVDRGVSHEMVRHRIASYTQESTRFVNYVKKMPPSFIYPQVDVECQYCMAGNEVVLTDMVHGAPIGGPHAVHYVDKMDDALGVRRCAYDEDWLLAIDTAEQKYKRLLEKKWRPQEARSVFPNALATKVVSTLNLRAWRHVFIMRTSAQAHPQYRQVMDPLLAQFQKLIPVLYEDIVPGQQQKEAMKLVR